MNPKPGQGNLILSDRIHQCHCLEPNFIKLAAMSHQVNLKCTPLKQHPFPWKVLLMQSVWAIMPSAIGLLYRASSMVAQCQWTLTWPVTFGDRVSATPMARPFAGQAYSPDGNNDVTSELRQLLGWALGIFDKLEPSSWQIYQSLASSWWPPVLVSNTREDKPKTPSRTRRPPRSS